jgi:hypothetical protein
VLQKGRFHSGDNSKLEQTVVCFLKYIDTTNRGWYFAETKCLDSRTIKRLSLDTVTRLAVLWITRVELLLRCSTLMEIKIPEKRNLT